MINMLVQSLDTTTGTSLGPVATGTDSGADARRPLEDEAHSAAFNLSDHQVLRGLELTPSTKHDIIVPVPIASLNDGRERANRVWLGSRIRGDALHRMPMGIHQCSRVVSSMFFLKLVRLAAPGIASMRSGRSTRLQQSVLRE